MTSPDGALLHSPSAMPLNRLCVDTARLHIRPLQPSEAEALAELTNTAAITDAIAFLTYPFTTQDAAALIERNQNGEDCFFGLRIQKTDQLIGVVGTHLQPGKRIEVGYWLNAAFAGQGYTSEAFKALIAALHAARPDEQIYAECRPDNAASWRVLTKHGFVPTGRSGERPGRMVLELLQMR